VSTWEQITISDNDPPVIENILYPSTANTGEELQIKAEIYDNIEMGNVFINFHFGSHSEKKVKMTFTNGFYVYNISISEDDLSYLYFNIDAFDKAGMKVQSPESVLTVIDSLPPVIESIPDRTYYQGQAIEIKATGTDNIGIESIEWVGSPLLVIGDTMTGVIDQVETFHIKVIMYDREGNSNFTEFNLTILDSFHDRDGDGIWDLKENKLGLDPNNNDTDGDGMPDGWELNNGLDPKRSSANNDQDMDGLTDLEEYLKGSDPNKAEKEEKSFPLIALIVAIGSALLLIILLAGLFIFIRYRKAEKEFGGSSSTPLPEQKNVLEEFLDEMDPSGIPSASQEPNPQYEQYTQDDQYL